MLTHGRVQDGTFDLLKAHLSDEAILELTYISLLYLAYAIFTRALRLEYDDVPERVVEIPIPGSARGAKVDIMSQMSDQPARG